LQNKGDASSLFCWRDDRVQPEADLQAKTIICRERRKEKLLCVFVGWARFFAHVFVNAVTAWAKKRAHPTKMLQTLGHLATHDK